MNSQSAANDLSNFKLYGSSSTTSLYDVLIRLDKSDWETGDNIYYIYVLTEPNTLDIRYVGITKNPKERIRGHLYLKDLKKFNHKRNWIKSLTDSNLQPDMFILEKINDIIEVADKIETYYIQELSKYFNLTNYYKNKKQGGEYFKRINHLIDKPVYVFDKFGNFINKYSSTDFCTLFETNKSYISCCISQSSLFKDKYFLSRENYLENKFCKYDLKGRGSNKKINCYEFNINNEIVNKFDSFAEAEKFYSIKKGRIHSCVANKNFCNGKIFSNDVNFNISNMLLNKGSGVKSKKKLIVYDLNNNFIGKYDSIRDCAKSLNIPTFKMSQLKNGVYKKHKLKIIEDMV